MEMRMSIIGLNHFNLRASRPLLEQLKAFYCGVLGLAQGERTVPRERRILALWGHCLRPALERSSARRRPFCQRGNHFRSCRLYMHGSSGDGSAIEAEQYRVPGGYSARTEYYPAILARPGGKRG